jgi:hypothetical protein
MVVGWRFFGCWACCVALAVACDSDDEKGAGAPEVAGAGGDSDPTSGSSSGGSSSMAGAGKPPVTSGSGGGGSGGTPATPSAGAAGEGGSAKPDASAGTGSGGMPDDPGSTCPDPSPPTPIDCDDYASATRDDNLLQLDLGALAIDEPLYGQVAITWIADGAFGEASVDWDYSPTSKRFVFHLPVEARYADEFTLPSWTFGETCGPSFRATAFHIWWDGVDPWHCGQEPTF